VTDVLRSDRIDVSCSVNGEAVRHVAEPRQTLADFLREECGLTGTKLGCEHGVCGACTVLLDGEAVRSCLIFAAQANGHEIVTVEGLAPDGELHPLQQAFCDNHALQCGFCTPGFLLSAYAFLRDTPAPSDDEIRETMSGNLCRCTGYQGIFRALRQVADGEAGR
jgi:carbon-monoxide dehydrogenase small subunit